MWFRGSFEFYCDSRDCFNQRGYKNGLNITIYVHYKLQFNM